MHLKLYHAQRVKLKKLLKKERDADQRQRYQIVLHRHRGLTPTEIALYLEISRTTVYRVCGCFLKEGIPGLRDRRKESKPRKITASYRRRLRELLFDSPQKYGWQRSTWTTELLSVQLFEEFGVSIHRTHIGRLLRRQGARWGRAKAISCRRVRAQEKGRCAQKLKRLIETLPPDETVIYQDEVDIHLNPKIGPMWTPRGQQFQVPTPGKNAKCYVFGGLNPITGYLSWTLSERKNSAAFIEWLQQLQYVYRRYRIIHVVCDNYIIHKTKKLAQALQTLRRIRLHFLTAYSPELNPIERLWGEVHANITRNHRCGSIEELAKRVDQFLNAAAPYPGSKPSLAWAS